MKKRKVFMVMPFSDDVATSNYQRNIKTICEKFEFEVRRADELFSVNPLYNDIVKEIKEASIIIVDITSKNANVFYELGMAHTIKPDRTIMITKDDYREVPFDVAHFRILKYDNSIDGSYAFQENLSKTFQTVLADASEIFEDEFKFTYDILFSAKRYNFLIGIVGLQKYRGILSIDDTVRFEGSYGSGESNHISNKAKDCFASMENIKNVTFENGIVSLTSKGQLLANYLLSKGIDCAMFQEEKFRDNYIPINLRMFDRDK